MDLFAAFVLLAAVSAALLVSLMLLVLGRKAMRDRRESVSARRRRLYRDALAGADRRAVRRTLGGVRRREAQVDLAAVLQDPTAARPDAAILDIEARRAGLMRRLRAQLGARSGPARGRAVLILTHLRLPDGVAALEHMLDDADPDVRLVTCAGLPLSHRTEAVGVVGDERAEPALVRMLARGGIEERISAARALGSVGGRRSRHELERALHDESWPLRAQAAKALGKVAIEESVPALEAVLDDPAWWVRANAASALRELGEPGHAALERALFHRDRYARDRARKALAMERLVVPVVGEPLAIQRMGMPVA